MINWPTDLITSIARRRAVLFLGAGTSMNATNTIGNHPPSWHQFLSDAIDRCPGTDKKEMKDCLKSGDYLTCCQLVKYILGDKWITLVEDVFLNPNYSHGKIHEHIFDLDSGIVITTNFDKIYENYARKKDPNPFRVKSYYDDDIVRSLRGNGEQRLLLKIHGCIDTPDKLIFTREDYSSIRHRYANIYRAIDALIVTHTFLFIGCGLNDPDLSLVLEQYARSFCAAPPHYILLSKAISNNYKLMLKNNYNVETLIYSSKNNHEELTDSIKDLVDRVEDRRGRLATSGLW